MQQPCCSFTLFLHTPRAGGFASSWSDVGRRDLRLLTPVLWMCGRFTAVVRKEREGEGGRANALCLLGSLSFVKKPVSS